MMKGIQELKEVLENGVKNVFTSENFVNYLKFSAMFHTYSVNNRILIFLQRPTASYVAGFNAWKKMGRTVKKGEHGIRILAPHARKRQEVDPETGDELEIKFTTFSVTYVFDVSQTEGAEIPKICHELDGDVNDYESMLNAIKSLSPVPITFEQITNGSKGYYNRADKRIAIKEGMSQLATIKTALHEITHATLHDEGRKSREQMETEAEATAFLTCSLLGLETGEYSFEYLASWASGADLEELHQSLDTISATATGFAGKINDLLDKCEKMQSDVA